MAIKDSDAVDPSLSFESHIVPEFITDNATPASLRPHSLSEYYVDGGLVPAASPQNDNIPTSGAISFSDFYGAVNVISVTFFEDPTDTDNNFYIDNNGDSAVVSKGTYVNLYDIADTFIPNVSGEQNVPFEFIIDSDACFNNSIQTGGYFADLTIINKGIIAGRGGDGAGYLESVQDGTSAIRILHNSNKITINNLNGAYIAGGGGGGDQVRVSGVIDAVYFAARGGGGGGWNGGNGGRGFTAVGAGTGGPLGGTGVVIKSKSDNSSGNDGIVSLQGSSNNSPARVSSPATGGQAGGGGGAAVIAQFTSGSSFYNKSTASSGGGGGNKITATASGGGPGAVNRPSSGNRQELGSFGAEGGSNDSAGGTAGTFIFSGIFSTDNVTGQIGGGGGWGAAGGGDTPGDGGKAVERTGTVTTLTYTTGPGTYYGTKDT